MFEMVRQLVREGSSGPGEKVESLGKKEIDGRVAVGFRTHNNMADMTLWADPQTARLVRVELNMPGGSGHGVMSNFRYDMELDPSLFSLEPPAGYTVQNMDVTMPVEDDLVNILRFVAEHNDGTFPAAIGMNNKEFQQAMQAAAHVGNSKSFCKNRKLQSFCKELQAQYGKDQGWVHEGVDEGVDADNQPITQKIMQKHSRA